MEKERSINGIINIKDNLMRGESRDKENK